MCFGSSEDADQAFCLDGMQRLDGLCHGNGLYVSALSHASAHKTHMLRPTSPWLTMGVTAPSVRQSHAVGRACTGARGEACTPQTFRPLRAMRMLPLSPKSGPSRACGVSEPSASTRPELTPNAADLPEISAVPNQQHGCRAVGACFVRVEDAVAVILSDKLGVNIHDDWTRSKGSGNGVV